MSKVQKTTTKKYLAHFYIVLKKMACDFKAGETGKVKGKLPGGKRCQ